MISVSIPKDAALCSDDLYEIVYLQSFGVCCANWVRIFLLRQLLLFSFKLVLLLF